MISLKNISKKYAGNPVVEDVSLTLPTEKIIAFIGSNGAGKSTLLSIISRLINATEGEVLIDDRRVSDWNNRDLSRTLSILTQSLHCDIRLTVEDLVGFGRFPYTQGRLNDEDREIINEALEYTGIADLRGRFLDQLSGGQRQMAFVAMAIAQNTKYILLDEPLNNLDMRRSVAIMKLLRRLVEEKQKTILIVIHDINFVSVYADYVVALKNGKVQKIGPVNEVIVSDELKRIYDIDIDILDYKGHNICVYYT